MDKSINEYLNFRRTQIMMQLQLITEELSSIVELEQELSAGGGDVFSDNNEHDPKVTEEEIIEIMKAGKGPWNTRKLIDASRERNPNLRAITHPNLGEQIISIIQQNPIFKTVKPGYWELTNES